MSIADDGTVYVTRREPGDLLALKDADGDGKSDATRTVARKEHLHGIAIRAGKIYLVAINELFVADIQPDGTIGELAVVARVDGHIADDNNSV